MSLRERILGVLGHAASAGDGSGERYALHERLRRLGDGLLADARSARASREAALTLLAADALMTFACEAMAELDPGGLADVR